MSSANNIRMSRCLEASFGVLPSPNVSLNELRLTQEDFLPRVGYVKSKELRSDEQTPDFIRNDYGATGSLDGEWSYGAYDDFELLSVFRATSWSAVITNTISISFAAADNSINRASGSFVSDGYTAFSWIRIKGAATNGAELYGKIASVVALKIVLSHVVLVNESAVSCEVEQGSQITNGTTTRSLFYQRQYVDLTNDYARYVGMKADTWELNTNAKNIITTKFGFLGKREETASATAVAGSGSFVAAPTKPIMEAIDHVRAILENGTAFSVTKVAANMKRNHREQDEVGLLGAKDVIAGSIDLEGSFDVYYGGPTQINKLLGDTKTSFAQVMRDADGNCHILDVPRVKFTTGKRSANGGINTDVIQPLAWGAYRHETEGVTARFVKFDA